MKCPICKHKMLSEEGRVSGPPGRPIGVCPYCGDPLRYGDDGGPLEMTLDDFNALDPKTAFFLGVVSGEIKRRAEADAQDEVPGL